jgi:hypothetical protein
MSLAFHVRGSFNVREATSFGMLFIRDMYGPVSMFPHFFDKSS